MANGWYGEGHRHALASKGIKTNYVYFEANGMKKRIFIPEVTDESVYSTAMMSLAWSNRYNIDAEEMHQVMIDNEDAIIKIMERDYMLAPYMDYVDFYNDYRKIIIPATVGGILAGVLVRDDIVNVGISLLPVGIFAGVTHYVFNTLIKYGDEPEDKYALYKDSCKLIDDYGTERLRNKVRRINPEMWDKAIMNKERENDAYEWSELKRIQRETQREIENQYANELGIGG